MLKPLAFSLLTLAATGASAASFETCPSEAFLVQSKPAKLYGVDLSTGSYRSLTSDMGTTGKINALAFNFHDNFVYGWGYYDDAIVRIGTDYQIEPIEVINKPNSDFYIGDISLQENAYYIFRRGSKAHHGLWRISLDPNSADYRVANRVADGQIMRFNIFDFAFHPSNGLMYSIASNGELMEIDSATGVTRELGDTGIRGTFGAIYFDVDGNLYASRNADGKVYRLNPLSPNIQAELFAQGPRSSNNDGARCALAPVVVSETAKADFGDAPDSYRTSMAANGARHGGDDESLFLGSGVDRETQAFFNPESDDTINIDDEDGVTFITALEAGTQAIVRVEANGTGFLNAWMDFNRNGQFDQNEQILSDERMSNETKNFVFDVPVDLVPGATWSRFRLSGNTGTGISGGVPSGEVEDHQVDLSSESATTLYYPSSSKFVTLAFEDLWPSVGDYDMNDFVVHYRTATRFNGNTVTGVTISGQMMAIGATFHNGFGVELPDVPREAVDQSQTHFVINGETLTTNPLEEGQTNAVLIFTQDIWDYVSPAEACSFYRTENDCGESTVQVSFSVSIEFSEPLSADAFADRLFNPFIFGTPGYARNSIFSEPPGRALEIHLKNRAPTDLANPELLRRADDRSRDGEGLYYQTDAGLPWAVEIGTEWKHPSEYIDLIQAYPDFVDWVLTEGATKQDWYLLQKSNRSKLYKQGN